MKSFITMTTIVASLMLGGGVVADTIYVNPDGSGDYTDIQSAVDAASDGDEIIVAPGTYTNPNGEKWEYYVVSTYGPGVTIRASGSPEETIIDAQGLYACIQMHGDDSGSTTPHVIDGFTIRGAAGVAVELSGNHAVELRNCIITEIQPSDGICSGVSGQVASLQVHHCVLSNIDGDPVQVDSYGGDVSVSVEHCSVVDNEGGLYFDGDPYYGGSMNVIVVDSVISRNNKVPLQFSGTSLEMSNTNITTNDILNGVVIQLDSGMINMNDIMLASNSSNEAVIQYFGGNNVGDSLAISSCLILANTTSYKQSVIQNSWSQVSIQISNTTFCGNIPDNGIYGEWTDGGGNEFLESCPGIDADGDGIINKIDNCDLFNPGQEDCDGNGVGDVCDIAYGTHPDCDDNGVPDICQPDCDNDGLIDACAINNGAIDFNPQDGVPDICQGVPTGACCINGACLQATEVSCLLAGGDHAGDGSSCETFECDVIEPCPGDADFDGFVNVNDVLMVISQYGVTCP